MKEEIENALLYLQQGKVILYPTDTVWGLGCDPTNENAVDKIFDLKRRSSSKAMILLIADIAQLYNYVEKIPEIAWDIVEYAERPLTVVYPAGKNVVKKILGDDGSIAIRLTRNELCVNLIRKFRKGIVSTSANISGENTPLAFEDISSSIIEQVDYTVRQEKPSLTALPSTIMKLELDGTFKFIRK